MGAQDADGVLGAVALGPAVELLEGAVVEGGCLEPAAQEGFRRVGECGVDAGLWAYRGQQGDRAGGGGVAVGAALGRVPVHAGRGVAQVGGVVEEDRAEFGAGVLGLRPEGGRGGDHQERALGFGDGLGGEVVALGGGGVRQAVRGCGGRGGEGRRGVAEAVGLVGGGLGGCGGGFRWGPEGGRGLGGVRVVLGGECRLGVVGGGGRVGGLFGQGAAGLGAGDDAHREDRQDQQDQELADEQAPEQAPAGEGCGVGVRPGRGDVVRASYQGADGLRGAGEGDRGRPGALAEEGCEAGGRPDQYGEAEEEGQEADQGSVGDSAGPRRGIRMSGVGHGSGHRGGRAGAVVAVAFHGQGPFLRFEFGGQHVGGEWRGDRGLRHRAVGVDEGAFCLGDQVFDHLDVAVDVPDGDARGEGGDDLHRPAGRPRTRPVARASSAFWA